MSHDLVSRQNELERILRRATALMLEGYSPAPGADPLRRALLNTQQKSSHRDLVTVFDRKVEDLITAELQRAFPGEAIVGEESSATAKGSVRERCEKESAFWLIDPIDGTANYSRSYPYFCSTAAFVARKTDQKGYEVLVGAVWDPIRQEMFTAAKGHGAWLNRSKLAVTQVVNPQEALFTTGFAASKTLPKERNFELFAKITQLTLGVRRDGSAALDLAYIAAGRTDGYWEAGLSPWDLAAGTLLVCEAGGQVTHHDGSPIDVLSGEILSSNGFLHKWLQDAIKVEQ